MERTTEPQQGTEQPIEHHPPVANADAGDATKAEPERRGANPAKARQQQRHRRGFRWRPWLRAIHRDVGYLAVGLTFVYALSGLAVNHIQDWDPNFTPIERQHNVQIKDPAAPDADLA